MKSRFMVYLLAVTLVGSLLSWGNMFARATGGRGTGNSWYSHSWGGFGGYSTGSHGGWAAASGGGHK
jgi:hypothetical protein